MSDQPNEPPVKNWVKPDTTQAGTEAPRPDPQIKLVKPSAASATETNTKARLAELTNVNRIVANAISLINDVEIKGAHAQPVTEILGWLTGFSISLTGQVKTLESTLPRQEEEKVREKAVIEPKALTPETAKTPAPTK